jgi:hypothetical protein
MAAVFGTSADVLLADVKTGKTVKGGADGDG